MDRTNVAHATMVMMLFLSPGVGVVARCCNDVRGVFMIDGGWKRSAHPPTLPQPKERRSRNKETDKGKGTAAFKGVEPSWKTTYRRTRMTIPSWKKVVCSMLGEGGMSWCGGRPRERRSNFQRRRPCKGPRHFKAQVRAERMSYRSHFGFAALSYSAQRHDYRQADPHHPFGVQAGLCGENGSLACTLPQRTWHRLSPIISCAHAVRASALSSLALLFDILRIGWWSASNLGRRRADTQVRARVLVPGRRQTFSRWIRTV
jgi:hypothetical protein